MYNKNNLHGEQQLRREREKKKQTWQDKINLTLFWHLKYYQCSPMTAIWWWWRENFCIFNRNRCLLGVDIQILQILTYILLVEKKTKKKLLATARMHAIATIRHIITYVVWSSMNFTFLIALCVLPSAIVSAFHVSSPLAVTPKRWEVLGLSLLSSFFSLLM